MKALSNHLRMLTAAALSVAVMCVVTMTACAQIVGDSSSEAASVTIVSSESASSEASVQAASSAAASTESAQSSEPSAASESASAESSAQMAVVSASSTAAQQAASPLPTTGMSASAKTLGAATATGVALILCAVVVRRHGSKRD